MYTTPTGVQYAFDRDQRFSPAAGKTEDRLIQFFPGMGCRIWLQTEGECCSFCNIPAATRFAVLGPDSEGNFKGWTVDHADYRHMFHHSLEDAEGITNLTLFNGGSFLTDREVPRAFRHDVYRTVAAHPTIERLTVESRPEFMAEAELDEAGDMLGGKQFQIAIGLESANDKIRNDNLKKFMGRPGFERAVQRVQNRGMEVSAYVFLKAPGLTEAEALQDVLDSCAYLADLGVAEIMLSCAFIPMGSYLEELYRAGAFRPPWLWTILEVEAEARRRGWPLAIGGFHDFPPPIAISENCDRCNDDVYAALDFHRQFGRLPKRTMTCSCKGRWARVMDEHQISVA